MYPEPQWSQNPDVFEDLLEAVINQQLSDKAAATITKRFRAISQKQGKIKPATVLSLSEQEIRNCGISFPKIKYMKGLAQAVQEKKLDLDLLTTLSDEEIVVELTKLNGIGRWTAEMILIFTLKRPDVFSSGDLGLRTAVAKLYGVSRDNHKQIEKLAKRWSPYRSLACRYLWKSLDNEPTANSKIISSPPRKSARLRKS